jgi:hypothetical protein
MKITIRNKYISSINCSTGYSKKICPFHEITKNNGSNNLDILQNTINSIQNNFRGSIPLFWKSFDELSSWRTLKNIKLVFRIIWLIRAYINWIDSGEDDEYNESKIINLQLDMFDDLPEGEFNGNTNRILENQTKLLLEKVHLCQCEYILTFSSSRATRLNIGNRLNLVEKILAEDGVSVCDNFDFYFLEIVKRIREELREVECMIAEKKELCQIPKFLWTSLFKKYLTRTSDPIYIDSDNNLITYCPQKISDSTDNSKKIAHLHLHTEETSPNIIHEVSFENQSYCILCDQYKQTRPIPIIHVDGTCLVNTDVANSKPYICTKICNALILRYNTKIIEHGRKLNLNFDNFRYAKNRMMEFYTGCADDKSELALLDHVDVKKYIILKFLDLLMYE